MRVSFEPALPNMILYQNSPKKYQSLLFKSVGWRHRSQCCCLKRETTWAGFPAAVRWDSAVLPGRLESLPHDEGRPIRLKATASGAADPTKFCWCDDGGPGSDWGAYWARRRRGVKNTQLYFRVRLKFGERLLVRSICASASSVSSTVSGSCRIRGRPVTLSPNERAFISSPSLADVAALGSTRSARTFGLLSFSLVIVIFVKCSGNQISVDIQNRNLEHPAAVQAVRGTEIQDRRRVPPFPPDSATPRSLHRFV